MGWVSSKCLCFDNRKPNERVPMHDDEIYEQIINEIQERRLDSSTWAKALIDSGGGQATTVAGYIRLRSEQLSAIKKTARIALWNPKAAAQWSVAFTPLFGAYIHMCNWKAMGEYRMASLSKTWIGMSLLVQCLILLLAVYFPSPQNFIFIGSGFIAGFVFFLVWYFYAARRQAIYIANNFGNDYQRNPWTEVLLMALAVWLTFLFLLTGIVFSKFDGTTQPRPQPQAENIPVISTPLLPVLEKISTTAPVKE